MGLGFRRDYLMTRRDLCFLTQIDMTRRDFDLPFFLENLKGF
jgi:hypothetical protein